MNCYAFYVELRMQDKKHLLFYPAPDGTPVYIGELRYHGWEWLLDVTNSDFDKLLTITFCTELAEFLKNCPKPALP